MLQFPAITAIALAPFLASYVLCAPGLWTSDRIRQPEIAGRQLAPNSSQENAYIVKLRHGVDKNSTIQLLRERGGDPCITHHLTVINGFAGHFSKDNLDILSPLAEYITPDRVVSPDPAEASQEVGDAAAAAMMTSLTARWNLYTISHTGPTPLSGPYQYRYPAQGGAGVDIYILDTGIYTQHSEFQGRASWGKSFSGGEADEHGHGTHVASIAAGATYGVAPKAHVIAVRVLDASGRGPVSGIVAGVQWVISQSKITGRPSIINLSLKGGTDSSLDAAVQVAIDSGVHVVAAAGNNAKDASGYSPGRVRGILTVGASGLGDGHDPRAEFSNTGSVVDLYAPGQTITAAWVGSPNASKSLSGTSQASPHAAGALALLIGELSGHALPSFTAGVLCAQTKISEGGLRILQVSTPVDTSSEAITYR